MRTWGGDVVMKIIVLRNLNNNNNSFLDYSNKNLTGKVVQRNLNNNFYY